MSFNLLATGRVAALVAGAARAGTLAAATASARGVQSGEGLTKESLDAGLVLSNFNEAPVGFACHGIDVFLAEIADVVRLFELLDRPWIRIGLDVVAADRVDVVIRAMNRLDLTLSP